MSANPGGPPLPNDLSKKSFVSKLSHSVECHADMSLAIIIVLFIIVIGMYIYYHGLFSIGPYVKICTKTRTKKIKSEDDVDGESDGAETNKLIESINKN